MRAGAAACIGAGGGGGGGLGGGGVGAVASETSNPASELATIPANSFSALIWSLITRRMALACSLASCGNSSTPRCNSCRVASSSRWISPAIARTPAADCLNRSVVWFMIPASCVLAWS